MANLYDTPYFEDYQGLRSLLTPENVQRGVNLLTPENVQQGVNFLQSNKGIVSSLAQNLTFLPSSQRAYVQSLAGSKTPITEDFFNADQLSEIKRRTAEQMANKSMIYDPENFGGPTPDMSPERVLQNVVPYGEEHLSLEGVWSDPKVDISSTFGLYNYKENPDGTISAIDKHDFDSYGGGGEGLYGQGAEADLGKGWAIDTTKLGTPRYKGERGLPFLPPVDFYGRTEQEAAAEEVVKDPFTGEIIKPLKERDYRMQTEAILQSKEEVKADAYDALKKEHITPAKYARIMGGIHAIRGDEADEEYSYLRDELRPSHIPVNVNLGKISHRDKLKANRNFARYVAEHRDIPSRIRKEAQKFAPRRITPTHSPHGGGGWSPSGADLSPGGGYGQSPTGSDIAGTPFSRGGILGAF